MIWTWRRVFLKENWSHRLLKTTYLIHKRNVCHRERHFPTSCSPSGKISSNSTNQRQLGYVIVSWFVFNVLQPPPIRVTQ